ncbi:LMBR1-like membrane protein [Trinorchestia longiramus]|nr:LMBR1-like membrane protein [Trinorchestia longiramus]
MGMGPLTFEIILTFFIAACVLYRYGNWYRHHILVTVAVLIAWYFSMLIVFVLPIDVSNTIYETCIHDALAEQLAVTQASELRSIPHSINKRASFDQLTVKDSKWHWTKAQWQSVHRRSVNMDDNLISGNTMNNPLLEPTKPSNAKNLPELANNVDQDMHPNTQSQLYVDRQVLNTAVQQMMSLMNYTTTTTATSISRTNVSRLENKHDINPTEMSKVYNVSGDLLLTTSSEINNMTDNTENSTTLNYHDAPLFRCKEPWSRVKPGVFPAFWRVVYWTSQVLTWLVLPLMQSYTKAGEFTVWGKLRSALIDNAIYYGSYLLIVGVLLLYIALRPDVYLDGSQLRAIAASASNTWGLFWLVLLLGYGLVEVPRWLWNAACPQFMLNQGYFKSAKLSHERAEAWDRLNDLLQSLQSVGSSIGSNHPLRHHLDTVESRVPTELLDRMRRAAPPDAPHADVPSEKALVRLHKQLLKALQHHNRVETQWALMVDKVIYLEDAQRNSCSHDTHFKHSTPRERSYWLSLIYTPTVEWLWVCRIRGWLLRGLAVIAATTSAAVVWSELTFFNQSPTLSLFAILVNIAKTNYDYFTIEIISTLTMAYIALCAYSTLFAVRVLNLYYLAPHHQTDQYSLIFSGMMLCRLTPPMCLNFLSLIHMDSHVISIRTQETHYTQIMGHMDVIGIISDGFNVYFPMMIVALCLATYYSLGSRLLSALGFQQFIGSDGFTTDLVDEGRTLINRECRRRQRQQESVARRREFTQRFGVGESTSSLYRSARQRAEELLSRPSRQSTAQEAAQMELLTPSPALNSCDSPSYAPASHGSPARQSSAQNSPQFQYSTASHYSHGPPSYPEESDRYSSPGSAHYATNYLSSGQWRQQDSPERYGESKFSRPRPANGDKGLFDDV